MTMTPQERAHVCGCIAAKTDLREAHEEIARLRLEVAALRGLPVNPEADRIVDGLVADRLSIAEGVAQIHELLKDVPPFDVEAYMREIRGDDD